MPCHAQGRLKFTLNPFSMFYQLLGPKLCARLTGCLCCLVCILLAYYITPVIAGNVISQPFLYFFG